MVLLDIVILVIVLVSILVGLWRGFIREMLSLAAWILAFWVAFRFTAPVAEWLGPYIDKPSIRLIVAFTGLFVGVMLLGALVGYAVQRALSVSAVTGMDRGFGAMFGLARGVAVVAVLVMGAELTGFSREAWWQSSVLVGYFEPAAELIRDVLPGAQTAPVS